MHKASVIIVTYNNLRETTAPCLESLFGVTTGLEFEVIAVDNHSSDGTPAYLEQLASREPRLRLIFNGSNRGFAGGNNDGIRAATGDVLVLLNSDTQVTDGWLEGLAQALERDPSAGLAGPVSNNVGNEQRIHAEGATAADILAEGRAWTMASRGDFFETERLGFFCVAMKREVVETVGLLDEGFGLGFFEDDDYCIRARRAGYMLVCAEDVFVYHRGGASYQRMHQGVKELLEANRNRLEKKINAAYRPRHPRERQLEMVESYLERMKAGGCADALMFKVRNRLKVLEGVRPRGPLKRAKYYLRLRKIMEAIEAFEGARK